MSHLEANPATVRKRQLALCKDIVTKCFQKFRVTPAGRVMAPHFGLYADPAAEAEFLAIRHSNAILFELATTGQDVFEAGARFAALCRDEIQKQDPHCRVVYFPYKPEVALFLLRGYPVNDQMEYKPMNRSTIYGIVKDQFLRQARPELNQFTVMAYQTSPFFKKQFDTQAYAFLMNKSDRLMLGKTTVITKRNPELREDFKQALAEVNKQINPSGARVGIMLGPEFSELVLEAVAGQEGLFDWIKNKFKGGNKPYQQNVLEFYTVNTDQRNATLSQGQTIQDVTRLTEDQHPIMKLSKCQSANLLLNLSANAVVIKSAALRTMPLYLCGYRLQKDVDFKVNTVSSDDNFDIVLLRNIQPTKTDKLTLEQFCKQMNINIQVNDASAVGKRKQIIKAVLAQAAQIFKTQSADWKHFIELADNNNSAVADFLNGTTSRCAITHVEITDNNAITWWKEQHPEAKTLSHGDEVDAMNDAWALVQEFDEKLMQATANLPIEWEQDYSGDGGTLAFTMK